MFDEKISSGEWNSFADYLAFYNLSDCIVLYEGFQNYCSLFRETFDFEVLSKITLPSISEGKRACLIRARPLYKKIIKKLCGGTLIQVWDMFSVLMKNILTLMNFFVRAYSVGHVLSIPGENFNFMAYEYLLGTLKF